MPPENEAGMERTVGAEGIIDCYLCRARKLQSRTSHFDNKIQMYTIENWQAKAVARGVCPNCGLQKDALI
jgi:hypothetical protein